MKAVATSGYVNDGIAGKAATELSTAFNALQHEHSYTGDYVNNNNGTHSQKCAFYDKCQTLSTGVAHSYNSSVTTQPTCTTAGVTTHTCVCGYSYTTNKPDATGHSWGEWSTVTAATCVAKGTEKRICNNDSNHTETRDIAIDGNAHNAGTPVRENEKDSNCTQAGSYDLVVYCTLCNKEISRTPQTIAAKGHTEVIDKAVDPTCTTTGLTEGKHCSVCGEVLKEQQVVDALGHKFTVFEKLNADQHTVKCSRNCGEEGSTYTEKHNIENGVCTDCGYVAKVKITFVDENDDVINSKEYTIGDSVTAPKLPDKTIVYADNSQHKVTRYSWNETPQETASKPATYKRVKTESIVACSYGDTATKTETVGKDTYDIFTCTVCQGEMKKRVADKTALNAAIVALQNDLDLPEAGYKYDAKRVADAKALIVEANAIDRYADQSVVNAKAEAIATAKTDLNAEENLAKYNLNFKILNYSENNAVIDEYTDGFENRAYGTTVDFDKYVIPTINDDTSLSGLPQYAVYKWVKIVDDKEQKLNTTDIKISDVVKSDATYICYLMNFKATDDTKKETRVRYLDKSGHTIYFDTATVGKPYTRKSTSIAPLIPYYKCTGWEPVFGDETNVGTRELVYRAIYDFNENEANRCTIVGLNGVMVNGTTGEPGYPAYYDEKIQLTGADKFAYANADGSIIAPINENYIFAPHLNGVDKTIYITKVEIPIEDAKSIITGVFTTRDDPTYNYLVINAQYYLPEGAKAVEAGAVIGKQNDPNVLKVDSALKVVSDTQGDNHEYSLQMSYSKNKSGTLYARSYLIYVDSKGDTHTVYSDIAECVLK